MDNLELETEVAIIKEHMAYQDRQIEDIKEVTNEIRDLSKSIVLLTEQSKRTADDIKGLRKDVTGLKTEPSKKWNTVIQTVITSIVSGVVALVISSIVTAI